MNEHQDPVNATPGVPEDQAEVSPAEEAQDSPSGEAALAGSEAPETASGSEIDTASIVEAVLFASDGPLPAGKVAQVVGFGDARTVKKQIAALNDRYQQLGLSFRIEEIAGGFQMMTLPDFHRWVSKLHAVRRESRLSGAAMETLAVVAYKQPVLRADIEAVRGVAVGDILNRLREMGLVKIVGRAEIVGRPMLYGTTRRFLEVFGLASLSELPQVESLAPPPDRSQPTGDATTDSDSAD